MFPVALAIGAGISALSSIAGGVSANKRRKKADQILEDRRRRLDEWYQSEMNQPYLDRADSRAMLKRIRDYNEDELKRSIQTPSRAERRMKRKSPLPASSTRTIRRSSPKSPDWANSTKTRYNNNIKPASTTSTMPATKPNRAKSAVCKTWSAA